MTSVVHRGVEARITVTIQGLVEDADAGIAVQFSATNAVIIANH